MSSRRRRILKGMLGAGSLALPGGPALSQPLTRAGADQQRLLHALPRRALIIGNTRYIDAPLRNPGNDARALAVQLETAGFQVARLLDAGREAMLDAISLRRPRGA